MNEGRRITSYSLSPEAEGKVEYVDTFIASYIQRSGGFAQRLILKNKNTNERIPTNEVHGMCLLCYHDIMQRQQQERG